MKASSFMFAAAGVLSIAGILGQDQSFVYFILGSLAFGLFLHSIQR